jgi:katanin p60 ATPase-containing subunit A1
MDNMVYQMNLKKGDEFFAKAEKLYDAGEERKSAECYERAAKRYLKVEEHTSNKTLRGAWKKKVENCEVKAKFLRDRLGGKTSSNSSGSSKKVHKEKKDEDDLSGVVGNLLHESSITFDQIGGLEAMKKEIKYTLGVSLAKKGKIDLQSWKNWLLYGPPGTGKTLLAAATSNLLGGASFFNVKVSSITSKYFGESNRIISQLYETARKKSPAIIFLDEFESICGTRDGNDSGVEKRILSTILAELDGLSEKGRDDLFVLTIAATNRPWDLDPAVLSRFDKKILVPLPDPETRKAILNIMIFDKGYETDFSGLDELVAVTEGLSGREIERLVKEVTNTMVMEGNQDIISLVEQGINKVKDYEIKTRPLTLEDFARGAMKITPVTSKEEFEKYRDWKEED